MLSRHCICSPFEPALETCPAFKLAVLNENTLWILGWNKLSPRRDRAVRLENTRLIFRWAVDSRAQRCAQGTPLHDLNLSRKYDVKPWVDPNLSRKCDHSDNVEPWSWRQLSWTVSTTRCPGNKNDQTTGMYRKAGGLAASAFSFLLPHIIQSSLEGIRCWCAASCEPLATNNESQKPPLR